jgi:hypothetical protein
MNQKVKTYFEKANLRVKTGKKVNSFVRMNTILNILYFSPYTNLFPVSKDYQYDSVINPTSSMIIKDAKVFPCVIPSTSSITSETTSESSSLT